MVYDPIRAQKSFKRAKRYAQTITITQKEIDDAKGSNMGPGCLCAWYESCPKCETVSR